MSHRTPRPALQQRLAEAILEAAARVLVSHGEQASMSDMAAAAGVARATVYRYFPSREALLRELADLAAAEAAARLDAARLAEVPVEEGVTRAIRALADVGDYFVVLVRDYARQAELVERRLAAPLHRLMERGQGEGSIRADIAPSLLVASLVGLVANVLAAAPPIGKEDMIVALNSLFLDGARPPTVAR